jgi:cytochrome c peroxidase
MNVGKFIAAAGLVWASSLGLVVSADNDRDRGQGLDTKLARVLREHRFSGRIESELEDRLGRRIDQDLANLGRLLWFDNSHSLHRDNTCAGCHSPSNGFGDTQSIAIGVDSNGIVGPNRTGPRNQRRSPMVLNTAFYPRLMWNGRFFANAAGDGLGDPFRNNFGFTFPAPEALTLSYHDHLLQAQAFIPPTETVEVAGFTGLNDPSSPFHIFDDGHGLPLPAPDDSGFRNEPIRQMALRILNDMPGYTLAFGKVFPSVRRGRPIDFDMFARAIAEFEFTLTFADAPIDQFARGRHNAMTAAEKRGALVFFGDGKCVTCHAVKGKSNEMFSDFQNYVAGIPQLAPEFGVGKSNMIYDGPDSNEDFGAMQISGSEEDKYQFRASPLRNISLSPAFFHNGAFARLEDAIRFHVNPMQEYNPRRAGIDRDLYARMGPRIPESLLDPIFRNGGIRLSEAELRDVTQFVKTGLLDERATKENLCKLVPKFVPSRLPVLTFEGCADTNDRKDKKDRD